MPAPSTAAGQTSTGSVPAAATATVIAPATASAGPGRERDTGAGTGTSDAAGDVVRWAVFCCVLVPVVLVVYGTSIGGAAGTALGLVSVTAACRLLLRRSERGLRAETVRTRHRN
ncbi:hypothetical protein [Streptomyces sp. NPDC056169]|uniref:hypothetical protein n=1 Tax=Streptomyces sp. NPDC056169 TaxID=3345734 RepID=UPI0035DF4627